MGSAGALTTRLERAGYRTVDLTENEVAKLHVRHMVGGRSPAVENEYLCLTLTKAMGLPSANVEMATFGGKRVLIVERFDRLFTSDKRLLRIPQEDCCQALSVPPPRKYEPDGGPGMRQMLELLKASDEPEADQRTFLKAQIVHDRVDGVLAAVAHGHGELHAVMPDFSGIHIGLRRHDIVERRHPKPAAGQQKDAEILRMPVRSAQ